MIPYLRQNYINWIDGMKINKDHFIAIDNNLISRFHDSLAFNITSYNYGILPNDKGKPSYNISIDIDKNNLLRVNIHELRAVTNSGVRIEISDSNREASAQSSFIKELDLKALNGREYYIVLSVNPFGKVHVGVPNPEEVPPRYPYTDYAYSVNVVDVDELDTPSSGFYHLSIGKIRISGSRCDLVDDFIPPCTTITSYQDLLEIYEHLDKMLSILERDCTTIVQKIYSKQQSNALAESVLYLSEAIMQHISSTLTNYRWFYKENPPIYMFSYFSSLGRVMKNTIDLKVGDGKEQMLNYFKNWIIEVNQGEFEHVLDQMINLQYNHLELFQNSEILTSFCQTVNVVFSKLSKLDYIGEKKEKFNMIIKTEQTEASSQKKKRSLFLD